MTLVTKNKVKINDRESTNTKMYQRLNKKYTALYTYIYIYTYIYLHNLIMLIHKRYKKVKLLYQKMKSTDSYEKKHIYIYIYIV